MANAFSKEDIIFFNDVLAGFDPNNITARQVNKFKPPSTQFERSALTVHRPLPYITLGTDGLVLAETDFVDRTQLTVPSTLNAADGTPSDIKNVAFNMNSVELNDPLQREKIALAATQQLSAIVDSLVATEVAQKGSIFLKDPNPLTTYSQIARAETQLSLRDVPIMGARTIIMNPQDYNGVSGDLAQRDATPFDVSLTAFERSRIPRIATFESFKANFMPTQNFAAAVAATVNLAQFHQVAATDANGNNVDNRTMVLNITTTTAPNMVVGDAFTIADVFAVSHIHKNVLADLQVFRVVAADAGAAGDKTVTITPAIVADGTGVAGQAADANTDYANCSNEAGNNAIITMVNDGAAAQPSNIFFMNDAVEIVHGSLATMDLDGAGVATTRASTDSGIEILFAKGSDVRNLGTEYRLTMWVAANVLNPEMCGNIIGTG